MIQSTEPDGQGDGEVKCAHVPLHQEVIHARTAFDMLAKACTLHRHVSMLEDLSGTANVCHTAESLVVVH